MRVLLPSSSFLVIPVFVVVYQNTTHTHTVCASRASTCKGSSMGRGDMKTGIVTVDLWVALHCSQIFTTKDNIIVVCPV